jgi:hypothetical protein
MIHTNPHILIQCRLHLLINHNTAVLPTTIDIQRYLTNGWTAVVIQDNRNMMPFSVINPRRTDNISLIDFGSQCAPLIHTHNPLSPAGTIVDPGDNFTGPSIGIDPCTARPAGTAGDPFETDRLDIVIDPSNDSAP